MNRPSCKYGPVEFSLFDSQVLTWLIYAPRSTRLLIGLQASIDTVLPEIGSIVVSVMLTGVSVARSPTSDESAVECSGKLALQ